MLLQGGPSDVRDHDKQGCDLARQRVARGGFFRSREGAHHYGESPHARRTVEGARSRQAGGDPGMRRRGRADLPREDRQVPLPGAAAGTLRAAARSVDLRRQADFFAVALRDREPPFEAAFPSLEPSAERRLCASATLWRSASIRSITGASAAGSGATISWPASFASSIWARSFR